MVNFIFIGNSLIHSPEILCVYTRNGNIIVLAIRVWKYDDSLWKMRQDFWNWLVKYPVLIVILRQ